MNKDKSSFPLIITVLAIALVPLAYILGRENTKGHLKEGVGEPISESESASRPSRMYAIGQDVVLRDVVLHVYAAQQWSDPNMYLAPTEPGRIFLAVDLSLQNKSRSRISTNPFTLRNNPEKVNLIALAIEDSAGRQYKEAAFLGAEPSFPSNSFPYGDSARGWVTFEIPENLSTATFLCYVGDYIRVRLW